MVRYRQIAKEMACRACTATSHACVSLSLGHPEGVIVNDDVHVDQWLIQKDGLVKFNDFSKCLTKLPLKPNKSGGILTFH